NAFQIAGLLSPRLRTLLLPRELLNKRGSMLAIHVGNVIAPAKLAEFESNEDLAAYLRVRTYLLAGRAKDTTAATRSARSTDQNEVPIASAESPDAIAGEIERLPGDQQL